MKKSNKEYLQTAMITGATMLGAFLARKMVEKTWEKVTHGEAPKNPADPDITWKAALAWTLVTGVVVGATRVLVRYSMKEGTDKLLKG
ncbi:MAG: DUF4235 domain-containing protein [Cyclobacteriaceae bacterium]